MSQEEIINIDNPLKNRVKKTGTGDVSLDVVKRAEDNLKMLSSQFDLWLEDEVKRLKDARENVREFGLVPPYDEALYHVCHDLKGQGETLGYPAVATICGNLCKLMDAAPEGAKLPFEIINNHVDSVCNIASNKTKVLTDDNALAVVNKLQYVVQEYIDHVKLNKAD